MFDDTNVKNEKIISRFQEELRSRLNILDIPLLETIITHEVELIKNLKEKDKLIENLKVEFENKLKDEQETHDTGCKINKKW